MTTVWLVRAGVQSRLIGAFEDHGLVAIGWTGLIGDLRQLSRWEVVERLESASVSSPDEDADELISFRDQMIGGDLVVVPDTTKGQLLVGKLLGPYEYLTDSPVVDPEDGEYHHVRTVEWWARGDRDHLAAHLKKDLTGRRSLKRLPGTGEWARVVEAIRDAPPKPARAPRAAGTATPRAPRKAAAPKTSPPPKDRVCPRCQLRKPIPQFIPASEVCADCRADE